jgi:hypothetical protein
MVKPGRPSWRRAVVAVVAAYALALQALLAALATSAHAGFGGGLEPLCLAQASDRRGPLPGDHADLCCTLACHASGSCAALAPMASAPVARAATRVQRLVATPAETGAAPAPPFSARAPPVLS